MYPDIQQFFYGAFCVGYLVAAVFFLKFWRKTRQTLLLIFACSFTLLGIVQCIAGLFDLPPDVRNQVYLIRLVAFVLIIVGIITVNIGPRKSSDPHSHP